jgi:hypothetical protein
MRTRADAQLFDDCASPAVPRAPARIMHDLAPACRADRELLRACEACFRYPDERDDTRYSGANRMRAA